MTQKDYLVKDMAEMESVLKEIAALPEYQSSSCVSLRLGLSRLAKEEAEKILQRAQEILHRAVIFGSSIPFLITEQKTQPFLKITCCFFRCSKIQLLEFSDEKGLVEWGRMTGRSISRLSSLQGVEILALCETTTLADFLHGISAGNEEIPFFGIPVYKPDDPRGEFACESGTLASMEESPRDNYLVGQHILSRGIVLALYLGEELHLQVDYLLGWKTVGREFTATSVTGNQIVNRFDDFPAAEIYRRYLNVLPDEYFIHNVLEFPLIVERDGVPMVRIPAMYDKSGRLFLTGDIREGEKVRLSYGNPTEIVEATRLAVENMRAFSPEAVFLIICASREFFLQESHAEQEITLYWRTLPNATPIRGLGELYRHHGKGGILGDALVAVGMREGEGNKAKPAGISAEDLKPKRRIIPLSHRLAAFTDATTQELGDMTEQARAANQAKSHFLSSMSHEIRTPINAVLGMNEMILRESREPEILSYASNVQSAAKSLLGIVNDILDFSKIEAGKMEIIPAEYELPSMLNDLVTLLKGRAEDKGLQFTVDADARLPRMLMGDEIRIKQVITNLLTNAVKYTKQGSVTLKVGFQPASGEAILLQASIIDTGIGIKEEDIPKLFSAFERIEEKRNRAIEGTGLGMNITKRILSLMGADLKVESRYGQGSTFSFQVEQKVVDATPVGEFADACKSGARMHQAYHKSFEAPDARILVVDDTEMNLTVVKGLLKQTKVKIDTAVSGQECLSMIAKNKYDIIFLDHLMPRMDGIATLREMKRMLGHPNEDTPVISLTANAISGAREEYIAAGFSDYLTKPIDSTELEGMIRNYLPPELVMAPADDAAQEREDNVLPDWVTQIKDLEADAGRKHCGGAKAYLEALGVFYESIERGADEIEKYWQDGNIEDYTTKVHALKSSARIIGATELSRRAEWLEAAGKQGNADEIQCDTPVLLALYRSYIQKLKPIARKSISQGNLPGITSEELDDAYASLREFAMSFDYDSIRYVMESLSSYRLPDAQQPRYERLRSAIERLDWEAIQEEL